MRAGDAKIITAAELEALRNLKGKPDSAKPRPPCKCGSPPFVSIGRETYCALCYVQRGLAREYQEVAKAFVPPGDLRPAAPLTPHDAGISAIPSRGHVLKDPQALVVAPPLPSLAQQLVPTQADTDARFPPPAQ
jgi:hypothetical protein